MPFPVLYQPFAPHIDGFTGGQLRPQFHARPEVSLIAGDAGDHGLYVRSDCLLRHHGPDEVGKAASPGCLGSWHRRNDLAAVQSSWWCNSAPSAKKAGIGKRCSLMQGSR